MPSRPRATTTRRRSSSRARRAPPRCRRASPPRWTSRCGCTPASVSVVTEALSQSRTPSPSATRCATSWRQRPVELRPQHAFFAGAASSPTGGLVLTDGLAEAEATFYHLYNVERVEVSKGRGFLYGANALAGRRCRAQPAKDSFWGAEVGGGSFDTYNAAPVALRLLGAGRLPGAAGGRAQAVGVDHAARPRLLHAARLALGRHAALGRLPLPARGAADRHPHAGAARRQAGAAGQPARAGGVVQHGLGAAPTAGRVRGEPAQGPG